MKKYSFQEPSDILLAAFAQIQSLTDALNEYIKIPYPASEMLVKSASLCDDCYKSAEKHQQQQQQQQIKLTQSQNSSARISNISSTASVSSVVSKTQMDAAMVESAESAAITEKEISPDDDGYCEIDEIRLPAITKSPSVKIIDPRRQSAPAPLPPPSESKECIEQNQKADSTMTTTTAATTSTATKPSHEHNKSTSQIDTICDEQILNASSPPLSSGSAQTVLSNKHDAEHIDVNCALYDSLSQPLSAMNLNSDAACPPGSNLIGMQIASPPCDLLLKLLPYVTSLNQHISQLLVNKPLYIYCIAFFLSPF